MAVDVDKICRTCLGLSGPLLSIYDGDSKSCLADMLRDFTKIKPTPADNMPTKVCLTCISEINHCYSFKLKCEQSNKTLRQLLPDAIPEEAPAVNTQIQVSNASSQTIATPKVSANSVETQTDMLPEDTPLNSTQIEESNNENMEIENSYENSEISQTAFNYEDSGDDTHTVAIKETLLSDDASLKADENNFDSYEIECVDEGEEYIVQVKQIVEKTENSSAETPDVLLAPLKSQQVEMVYDQLRRRNAYKCSECTQHFISLSVLNRHLIKFHNLYVTESVIIKEADQFFCKRCKAVFKTKRAMSLHIKNNICSKQSFKCTYEQCEHVFETAAQLDAHKTNEHIAKSIQCPDCKESFGTQVDLSEHQIEQHKRPNHLQCNICKKVFTMMSALKDHLRIHTGEKPFKCTKCDKAFTQKSNLNQHMQRHNSEKVHICMECNLTFVTRSELFSHQRKHTRAQPFKCEFCEAAFSSSSSLKKHRRQHTGEKPYACDICPMRFAALNVLKNHRRTHTGEKPFFCEFCDKKFAQQGDCLIHMKLHDDSKCLHCLCERKFATLSQLKKHQRTCKPFKVEPENSGVTTQKSNTELIENNLAMETDEFM